MSVGSNLQEMENVVTKGAKPAEPMPKLTTGIPDGQTGTWEDLGGPTPENYRADDDSAKLKEPGATLSQVKNVVNKGAKSADPMKKMSEEAEDEEEEATEEDLEAEEALETEAEEGEEEVEEEFSVEEDVNALLEGEELSEEFQDKAKTVFEAAVRSKIASLKEALENRYASALVEQVEAIKSELTERVDSYLEYVSNEWINENQLQVETGLRGELSESFMTGLKNLFEEHYVEIPEEKYNVLEAMVEKLDEMETKLNEQIDTNIALTKRLSESVSDNILDEVSEGLALSQKEKLASLAEGVEFDSEEQYREKLVTLREAYFASKPVTNSQEVISEEAIADDVSPAMAAYLNALTKFN
jgi:hypothetical protein